MANGDNHTIGLYVSEASKYIEALCETDMLPGRFAQRNATNKLEYTSLDPSNEGIMPLILVENRYEGVTINDLYLANSRAMARICLPGDEVLAWIADGEAVDQGTVLVPGANGTLIPYGPGGGLPVAISLEVKLASGDERLRVEII